MISVCLHQKYSFRGKLISAFLIAMSSLLLLPQAALACGGLFSVGIPVSQESERIIFTVDSDELTMYEQLSYKGEAKDFAWVLPVPSIPTLTTAPATLFSELERATQPGFYRLQPPPCGLQLQDRGLYTSGAAPSGAGVKVLSQGAVGPYAYEVVSPGSNAQELTAWLQKHQYTVPANLQRMIEPYIQAKMLFLAMRLQPKADVQDIVPVKVTVKVANPQVAVKLRMAAASASARMNLLVWIFGNQRYIPQNYASLEIHDEQLTASDTGVNYLPLVDQTVDKSGGQAFITEYAQPTDRLKYLEEKLPGLVTKYQYVTRLYTRIKPEHMTADPVFVPRSGLPNVNNIHPYQAPAECDSFNLFLGSLGWWGYPIVGGLILAIVGGAGGIFLWRRKARVK